MRPKATPCPSFSYFSKAPLTSWVERRGELSPGAETLATPEIIPSWGRGEDEIRNAPLLSPV